MTVLKGMTWSHPRGYDPMVACAALWSERSGVAIDWDKRSLQDFESFPVEELARAYDLIVIDHPHTGQIVAEGCLAPLDTPDRAEEMAAIARGSVGPSFASYTMAGRQWALPLDAATQVQAWRPDLLDGPVTGWDAVIAQARAGRVVLPLRPPHVLMCVMTFAANLGRAPAPVETHGFLDPETGAEDSARLQELAALVAPECHGMDPIAAFEAMAEQGSGLALCPYGYGYANYALDGFRPHRLAFGDIPVLGTNGPCGAALGGTGIAVSARSSHVAAARDFAYYVASGPVQAGPYAAAGGQPGHRDAWTDPRINARFLGFFRNTLATLDASYLRPRHDGYMIFQQAASEVLDAGLKARTAPAALTAKLNEMYQTCL
ncbi:extracellular solute-binding protein [Pseudoponticoccus marisrubri]|uniref:ABC transporter substrate-binding protein n=1 Tax=Pseudoponticoccus marisrubri TaxID=1685382 RepID=A0A0W7WH91_9RHOB|nr:extracellular solute-binding protein [Pseudoponticoccus marisrubri]KUF09903.1 ABC transporter substrate-binding protein [Pseudoponticoccus marisrubri]